MSMFFILMLLLLLQFFSNKAVSRGEETEFGFNGDLYKVYGIPNIDPNGLLNLTNSAPYETGQAFYNLPVPFKNSPNGTVSSFSTTFVFALISEESTVIGDVLAFAICPTKGFPDTNPSEYLGLFNSKNDGDFSNHIVAVEFDTSKSQEISEHVGIDINSVNSVKVSTAGYYKDNGIFKDMSLINGKPIQAWIEYDSSTKQLDVTIHPIHLPKPNTPLLSLTNDLSPYLLESMYVGFTSSTGASLSSHYILGWAFKLNGTAANLDLSRLPKLPDDKSRSLRKIITISFCLIGLALCVYLTISVILFYKEEKLTQVIENWEVQFGPHKFAYKDLYIATKGFDNSELLGKGGFGKVYKGTLLTPNIDIAVKKVSHDSRQGMREFVAEIMTIGRLGHPNLVRLLGYCRRKGELYLVYDCMPKGSLDKFLYFHQPEHSLDWSQRFKIIKDVATGLCYLHQQWVQVIIHRDIKPGNILLDDSMNGKLGDFGLAKLCDHGTDPQTSRVAGTFGYISPELSRTGKASTSSDVFAFGVLMLEITCGRRPVLPRESSMTEMVLTDWVLNCWEDDILLQVVDERIKQYDGYLEEQVIMVLKLGLLCSHRLAAIRPSMSSVIQFLEGVAQLPNNLFDIVKAGEDVGAIERLGILAAESLGQPCSVATLTFTEPFVSQGR